MDHRQCSQERNSGKTPCMHMWDYKILTNALILAIFEDCNSGWVCVLELSLSKFPKLWKVTNATDFVRFQFKLLLSSFVVKITFSNYKSVHPALEDDAYNSSEDETLEAGYDEEVDKPITFKVTITIM